MYQAPGGALTQIFGRYVQLDQFDHGPWHMESFAIRSSIRMENLVIATFLTRRGFNQNIIELIFDNIFDLKLVLKAV